MGLCPLGQVRSDPEITGGRRRLRRLLVQAAARGGGLGHRLFNRVQSTLPSTVTVTSQRPQARPTPLLPHPPWSTIYYIYIDLSIAGPGTVRERRQPAIETQRLLGKESGGGTSSISGSPLNGLSSKSAVVSNGVGGDGVGGVVMAAGGINFREEHGVKRP